MRAITISESPADEAALRILADALSAQKLERVEPPYRARSGGWSWILKTLRRILRAVHYGQSAEVIVLVLDSDLTPVHATDHEAGDGADADCRLCRVKQAVASEFQALKPLAGRARVVVALGLAVPCLEAWLLFGQDPHVGEGEWARGLKDGRFPFTAEQLKIKLYEVASPSLELETQRMVAAATGLSDKLDRVEKAFPGGFGHLARELRKLGTGN